MVGADAESHSQRESCGGGGGKIEGITGVKNPPEGRGPQNQLTGTWVFCIYATAEPLGALVGILTVAARAVLGSFGYL